MPSPDTGRCKVLFTHRRMARGLQLDELFAREWIQRAWTFQELVLSSNPVVLCGDKMVEWEDWIDFVVARHDHFDDKTSGFYWDVLGDMPRISPDKRANWSSAIKLLLTFRQRGSPCNNFAKLIELDGANHVVRRVKFILGVLLAVPLIGGYCVLLFTCSGCSKSLPGPSQTRADGGSFGS